MTCEFRGTHSLPTSLMEPLPAWATPYEAMARESQLRWVSLPEVIDAARRFLNPVLAGGADATWSPDAWVWERANE